MSSINTILSLPEPRKAFTHYRRTTVPDAAVARTEDLSATIYTLSSYDLPEGICAEKIVLVRFKKSDFNPKHIIAENDRLLFEKQTALSIISEAQHCLFVIDPSITESALVEKIFLNEVEHLLTSASQLQTLRISGVKFSETLVKRFAMIEPNKNLSSYFQIEFNNPTWRDEEIGQMMKVFQPSKDSEERYRQYQLAIAHGFGSAFPPGYCPICLQSDENFFKELRCGHSFHRECVDTWLFMGRTTCPLCNRVAEEQRGYVA